MRDGVVLTLDDPAALDVSQAGGKGASLARLRRMGLRVPDALIVTGEDSASRAAIEAFVRRREGTRFAVRSSALDEDGFLDSFAGQHETLLDVTARDVSCAIEACRRSFQSERARAYRRQKGLADPSGGAVVVQEMVRPDIAGVAFSLDPRNGQDEFVVVEYVEGLGDRLVGGEVTPRRATIRKSTLEISGGGSEPRHVPVLRQLAAAACRCADEWRSPVDIEFAAVDGALYMLQCRPVTTFVDDPRPVYELSYTRSMTIMQQAAWHKVYKISSRRVLGWECPFDNPATFFHLHGNSVKVWENARILDWFIDKVQAENLRSPSTFPRVLAAFEAGYGKILDALRRGGTSGLDELKSFMAVVDDFAFHFAFVYFSSMNESTPEPIKSQAVEWRTHDESWAKLSEALVASIRRALPQAACREIAVVPEDLDDPPDGDALQARLQHFVYIPDVHAQVEALSDSTFLMGKFRLSYPKVDPDLLLKNQLAGDAVFGDTARTGKARVIRHRDDIEHFQAGEILVSPMTTPDFLPAMTRASAMLTDEGGVLCHAAIVARELKIPCIVGLKVASRLIRTGDVVEIDPRRGLVTMGKST